MKIAEIVIAALAFITGMIAAWYWYRASKVQTDPGWGDDGLREPVIHSMAQGAWIVAMMQSAAESARWNKTAAIWTAATVALTTIAGILSVIHT